MGGGLGGGEAPPGKIKKSIKYIKKKSLKHIKETIKHKKKSKRKKHKLTNIYIFHKNKLLTSGKMAPHTWATQLWKIIENWFEMNYFQWKSMKISKIWFKNIYFRWTSIKIHNILLKLSKTNQ